MGLLTLSAGAANIRQVQIDSIAISVFKKLIKCLFQQVFELNEKMMFLRTTMKFYIIHINCHKEIKIQEAGGVYFSPIVTKKINVEC